MEVWAISTSFRIVSAPASLGGAGVATQSMDYSGIYRADRATDFTFNTFSHTNCTGPQWWQVSIYPTPLSMVYFFNRAQSE